MEDPAQSSPSAGHTDISPVIGYSLAATGLWLFRKPLFALVLLAVRTALALIHPALLVLGAIKAFQMARFSPAKPADARPVYPGDDEALTTPARSVEPVPADAGLEV